MCNVSNCGGHIIGAAIAELAAACSSLRQLRLDHWLASCEEVESGLPAVAALPQLTALDLSHASFLEVPRGLAAATGLR